MDKFRQQIKKEYQAQCSSSIACNGIRIKISKELRTESSLFESLENLKEAQTRKLTYCIGEWAKISLFLMFNKSFNEICDSELLELFELARNPSFEGNLSKIKLKGSIGLIHDQFLSILWILVVTVDSKMLFFKMHINMGNFTKKVQRLLEICAQNTETLRNTTEIANHSEMKAQWWKLRKSLDTELMTLCDELGDNMFSCLSVRTLF